MACHPVPVAVLVRLLQTAHLHRLHSSRIVDCKAASIICLNNGFFREFLLERLSEDPS